MRLILLILAVGALFWWVGRRKSPPTEPVDEPQAAAPEPAAAQQMVSCARCGLHLPAVEALRSGPDGWACCTEHQEPAA